MGSDGFLELLDVLRPALSESRLGLAVSLLPFLRCGIDLAAVCISIYVHATRPMSLVNIMRF